MVRKNVDFEAPLTVEEKKKLNDLKDRPVVFDDDCPEISGEELKEFHRVTNQNSDNA
ncbi:MAG: hypothetical protein IJJ74_00195 [Eubacterium sp.]|nr:hypothetical protein [Eubacterium sp.]